ncbi:MAG: hypothetical protein KDK70_01710 [Myxococcales bacterium]|nr:hypothetical protein [Myxococcales bacterium]
MAVPPPSPGSTTLSLRLTRPEPSVAELEERLLGVLTIMGLDIEPDHATAWAQEAHAIDDPDMASITEPLPGVVVTYDPWLDDLLVFHRALFEGDKGQQTDEIPWSMASDVLDDLVAHGLVDPSIAIDEAEVSFVRSGVGGPDGSHEQWVEEIRFDLNAKVGGIRVLDAGVRIGITPAHHISSIRLTDVDVEQLGPTFIEASEASLRESFAAHVAGSTSATIDSVIVTERRPVYGLSPSVGSTIALPLYLVQYSIVTADEDSLSSSRATMVFLSLTHPSPLVELALP